MANLKLSLVLLMALFAVTWSSVVLEEKASAPVEESVSAPVLAEEDSEKQPPGPGGRPPRRCSDDRRDCYQTNYCDRRCTRTNTGPLEACHAGGLGNQCDDFCRCKRGKRSGRADGCFCYCY